MNFGHQLSASIENPMFNPTGAGERAPLPAAIASAQALIASRADLDTADENGESPLIRMLNLRLKYCLSMHDDEVDIGLVDTTILSLIENGARTDVTDREGRSVLDLIIENPSNGYLFIGAIKQKIHLPDDAIQTMIDGGMISKNINHFLDEDCDDAIDELDHMMTTYFVMPLAAALGNERFLKLLIETVNTAKINKFIDGYDHTPMFHAMHRDQWDCVEILLLAGNLEIPYMHDPIISQLVTGRCTNMTVVNHFVSHMPDSCSTDFEQYTSLKDSGYPELIEMLKNANVDILQEDALGETLLTATMDSMLKGSEKEEQLAVLLKYYPQLASQIFEIAKEDYMVLPILFDAELDDNGYYADEVCKFIIEEDIALDFDSPELLEGVAEAYASSLLDAAAPQML